MAKTTLLDEIDKAAATLLEKISSCQSVLEQVKIFESVTAWAEQRSKLIPAKKDTSPLAKMKAQLHGGSRAIGGSRTPPEDEEGTASLNS